MATRCRADAVTRYRHAAGSTASRRIFAASVSPVYYDATDAALFAADGSYVIRAPPRRNSAVARVVSSMLCRWPSR